MTEIERLKAEIESADCIVIGAGAGLSTAAGFTYSGERFERFFSDFETKYGFHDMYTGGFFLALMLILKSSVKINCFYESRETI